MNSINIKMEKANAILTITTLFRFIEMFVFLILISRFSSQLPFSGISFAVFSPSFVFVIGNVIVLILLFKSRAAEIGNGIDVYDECVRRCEKNVVNDDTGRISIPTTTTTSAAVDVVLPSTERKICRSQSENLMIVECKSNQTRRKQKLLRRSVTERKMSKKVAVVVDGGGSEEKSGTAEDELSSEEFRRTVEAFIKRQQQSLRDEELSPVEMEYIGGE